MIAVPTHPKIYHITHIDNLSAIAFSGKLISDATRVKKDIACTQIGLATLKRRRPKTKVGEYVPFYFCPRSVMLYFIHMGNHTDLPYQGGQQNIIHLQADLREVVQRADAKPHPWAFSNGNASAYVSRYFNRLEDLTEIDWAAVETKDFREPQIKAKKQAEFLTFDAFPWNLIRKIGTINSTVATEVDRILTGCPHRPTIEIKRDWYY
jgi:hypothetical protein